MTKKPVKKKRPAKSEKAPVPADVKSPAVDESYLLELSAKTTSEDVPAIVDQLLANRGKNLVIEAGKVERIDTPFIEVMVATSKLWLSDGKSIEIANVTEAFESYLELLGISLSKLEVREQAQ